jgi:hypothetical protein
MLLDMIQFAFDHITPWLGSITKRRNAFSRDMLGHGNAEPKTQNPKNHGRQNFFSVMRKLLGAHLS